MKYFLKGMTKKTPKKPAHAASAMSLPISFAGSFNNPRRYMAGTPETKRIPNPPAAVAALQASMDQYLRYVHFKNDWKLTIGRCNSLLDQMDLRLANQGAQILATYLTWS